MQYSVDIETNGLLDTVSKIHCICLTNINDYSDQRIFRSDDPINSIEKGLEFIQTVRLVAHNGVFFDLAVIKKLYNISLQCEDTLLLSRLMCTDLKDKDFRSIGRTGLPKKLIGSHGLKAWGYRLGELKGDYGDTTDWSVIDDEMVKYCTQDSLVTAKLYNYFIKHESYSHEASELEHQFAEIIQRQVSHGFYFYMDRAVELQAKLVQRKFELEEIFNTEFSGWEVETKTPEYYFVGDLKAKTKGELILLLKSKRQAGGGYKAETLKYWTDLIRPSAFAKRQIPFNPNSRHHIARCLREKYGWDPKEFTATGEPILSEDVLEELPYKEAKYLSEYFRVQKVLGMLCNGQNAWLKLLTKYNRIHGDVVTNGAVTGRCTHKQPNIAQVPSNDAPYGKECRSLFGVPDGYDLVGADASGLELRCFGHFLAYYDNGAYIDILLKGDIHTANQEAAGLPERRMAKTFIYAFLYGAGDAKIGSIVDGSSQRGKALKNRFMANTKGIKTLVDKVKSVASRGWLKGLDGRRLNVRSTHSALNTLLQSAGALAMKKALIIADRKLQESGLVAGVDYEFVANIHDEIQCEVKKGLGDTVGVILVQSIKEAGEHFKFNCPLDGEYKVGSSWSETH